MYKKVVILGGGTFHHVRSHLSLAAPAFGNTARQLFGLCCDHFSQTMEVQLKLTKMADPKSKIETNDDVDLLVTQLINDNAVKVVFFNVAMCDYTGHISGADSGKHAERLSTSRNPYPTMQLVAADKVISAIRQHRKDIFLVGFKTTCGAEPAEQFRQGLNLLKKASCNLVLANDTQTRNNMIITPEEGVYGELCADRFSVLRLLVHMTYMRSHLSFTRSTVVDGQPVPWSDPRVPDTLRAVINHCIKRGAYKTFNGVTTGHFAVKLGPGEFLTSIRKTNFNDIEKHGMVYVRTDGDDSVIAYGAKPSVGGQSQRIVFSKLPEADCIVHFHCPVRPGKEGMIPTVSQLEYECGSHECGNNTAQGLQEVAWNVHGVMLDKHGPNIVFHHSMDPQVIIDFIEDTFDLEKSTSGFEQVYLPIMPSN